MSELIVSNLKPFMFFPDVLNKISNAKYNTFGQTQQSISYPPNPNVGNNINININIREKRKGEGGVVLNKAVASPISKFVPDFFIPCQKDKLFWCFYIILFGMEKYEIDTFHSFSVEKKLKIESIERMGSLTQKLKDLKIKRVEIENELLSNNDVSLKCLYTLCAIHSISIIIIVGKKYYMFDFDSSSNLKDKKQNVIFRQSSGEFSVYTGETPTESTLVNSLYLVENVCKPIKSATSYLVSELKDLCVKMSIPLEDSTGKPKCKNKLYQDILLFIHS